MWLARAPRCSSRLVSASVPCIFSADTAGQRRLLSTGRMMESVIDPAEHIGLIHAVCRRHVPDGVPVVESDVFGEAAIGLVKAARNFDPGRGYQFSTYASRVMRGEMAWRWKQRFRQSAVFVRSAVLDPDELPAADSVADEQAELLAAVAAAVESLTPRQQQVVRLRLDGLTFEECAAEMGVTKQCCQQTEANAHRHLRRLLLHLV